MRLRRLALDAAITAALIAGIFAWQRRGLLPAEGEAAPDVALRDLDGRPVRLADWRGRRVQLHFWATWCRVCRFEHGALNAVHDGLAEGSALLAIVADGEEPERIRAYVREAGIRYPVLLAGAGALDAFRVDRLPTNYFLDAEGRIVGRDVGVQSRWGMKLRLGCARGPE